MESIYLDIAGFNIKLVFHKTEIMFLGGISRDEIARNYRGFISNKKQKKTDFLLEFIGANNITTTKKNFSVSICFYEEGYKDQIITYYHISSTQFVLIIRNIVEKLLKNDGFIIHCSACNINGKANVFIGPSGAGKSTIVSLLYSQYPILADDIGIIKREGGNYYFYQTPFLEKNNFPKHCKRYPIDHIFFLQKAKECKILKIIQKENIFEQIANQVWTESREYEKERMLFLFNFFKKFNRYSHLFFSMNSKILIKLLSDLHV